jgi:acyl-CoA reductase-like NAD-dependent aldehyde dehydrogenase
MAEIIAESGALPPGVFNVICGGRETGRALVSHPTPQMVAITGSVRAGMQVAEAASADLKRVHLELGGKAPVVIFDDADVAAAAEWLAVAGYFNAGQDCTAATRVLAAPRIYDDFVAALHARDAGSDVLDDAAALVAEWVRERAGLLLAADLLELRAADAGDEHAHEHLAEVERERGELGELERGVVAMEEGCFHR